jgi:hypothetical protein
MKKTFIIIFVLLSFLIFTGEDCGDRTEKLTKNTTALDEQVETEKNQRRLFTVQPPPKLDWSLERDNLRKRSILQNDRTINFFVYVFIEGFADPIGYYQINKLSSVNSQLTNTEQAVYTGSTSVAVVTLPSPAEDGSYGSNGDGMFGFTPEDIYLETNMKYITSTIPLQFSKPVIRIAIIDSPEKKKLLEHSISIMNKQ